MKHKATLGGNDLTEMFVAGASWLEKIVSDINALNVYPVPDGDCGTNMMFTMRTGLTEINGLSGVASVSSVAEAMAKGALMGARGNSGVILSQIWRGFFAGLRDKETIDARDLAEALKEASEVAYVALSNPVEGTILTVVRDAATAAEAASVAGASLQATLEAAVDAARDSVINTPNLLQVLKDAKVVDAGGHGLFTILEGALLQLKDDLDNRSPELLITGLQLAAQQPHLPQEEDPYGFCTQFMINEPNLPVVKVRESLEGMGQSVIVVGDEKTIRVHIHTLNPYEVIQVASAYGTLDDIDINDMDEQHIEFLVLHQEKLTKMDTAVIAVVNGEGIIKVFSDLGVSAIIPGGQTMNPSTIDILQAAEEVIADNIILLPNNKNVVATAHLIQPLTKKNIRVIPTETVPQGVCALIAFAPEADIETNVAEMTEAANAVKTIEITRATRSTEINGMSISQADIIGLLDNELLAVGDNYEDVILKLLGRIDMKDASIITLYHGKDADETEAEQLSSRIGELHPTVASEVVSGGQPHYKYIISIE